ncbi:transient receptor potential cation channel subfamily V member 5-like isoform X2 [Apostichopus japonicus]
MGVSISKKAISTEDLGNEDQVQGREGLYRYVNLQGGGELVDMTRKALRSGCFDLLEAKIASEELRKYMYNDGMGEYIPVSKLIEKRNREHQKAKPIITQTSAKKRKLTSVWPESDMRLVCWRLEERGSVGETILHLCFLNASFIHIELAKRLLKAYPCLAEDIYVGDLYYGESCLHLAVVNENMVMVKMLLRNGANVNQRCCGSYFMTDDQQTTRRDTIEHEWYKISSRTNYEGLCYYGEYPLSFAACLGKPEIVLYLHSKGADVNLQDTNGNTALHMTVLHNNEEMFLLLYELGADTKIKNRQGYTVLSLSASLGRAGLFHLIIGLERQLSWKFTTTTCARYELQNLDSINPDGRLNTKSVLYALLSKNHSNQADVELSLHGLIEVLIQEKWKYYGRFRFYRILITFLLHIITLMVAIYLRPVEDETAASGVSLDNLTTSEPFNGTLHRFPHCYLYYRNRRTDVVRIIVEFLCLAHAIGHLISLAVHSSILGFKTYALRAKVAPARELYLLACLCIITAGVCRIPPCFPFLEDVCLVIAILLMWPYCFFFLRGFTKFGKFIAMIYKMMASDLVIFFLIYAVVIMAFSQAMHVIYIGFQGESVMYGGSIISMFVMSLGELEDIYESFDLTRYPTAAKACFWFFMVNAGLLQLNLFIAMMGNTFNSLDSKKYEAFKQWAQIILVLEQDHTNSQRKKIMLGYSTPGWTGPNSRAISLQTQNDDYDDLAIQVSNRRHARYKNMVFVDGSWQEPKATSAKDVSMNVPNRSCTSMSGTIASDYGLLL